jgi:hypothetical protein
MSRLNDFYQQAHKDSALKAELAAVTQGDVAGVIGVAGKHGVTLEAADFAPSSGALDDDALAGVAGGMPPPSTKGFSANQRGGHSY